MGPTFPGGSKKQEMCPYFERGFCKLGAECDFFHANADRVAVPLTGPGGKIAVFETRKTGRIPDGVS